MAKKDKKKDRTDPAELVDAVRGAVERTFQNAGGGRGVLDDVAAAAQRIRESFDDLRVADDVRGLRAEVEALSRRVAELEKQQAKPAAPRRKPAARKPPAKPSAARTAAATTGPKRKPASG